MKIITSILLVILSLNIHAECLEEQCEDLLQRLETLNCAESLSKISDYMKTNKIIIESYELENEDKRQAIIDIHKSLRHSARTVQDCLIKHTKEPRHKSLITAQVSMTTIVYGLKSWSEDEKYILPPIEYLMEHYQKEIQALDEFSK